MKAIHNILLFVILAIGFSSHLSAQDVAEMQQLFRDANAAYDSGDYRRAADLYEEINSNGYSGWELYYNLGNAYYRMDEIGRSVLNYERALQLAPNKQIVKDNLALASSKTVDNIDELPRMFLVEWTQSIVHLATPRGWRTMVVILVTLLSASVCLFFVARNYRLRKTMFIVSTILLLFAIIFAINAAISVKNATNNNRAVVTAPMVVVKGSPDAKSVDKFILHEGARMTITDRQDNWWQIEIADGKSGWIESGAESVW